MTIATLEDGSARNSLDHLTDAQLVQLRTSPVIGEATKERIHAELARRRGADVPRATQHASEDDLRKACRDWCKERGAVLVIDAEQGYRPDHCRQCGAWLGRGARTRLLKGFPDLVVLWPPGRPVWWIETKRWPNKQTPDQLAFQAAAETAGEVYILAYGTEDLEERWKSAAAR